MRNFSRNILLSVAACGIIAGMTAPKHASAQTLTGANVFSTNGSGAFTGGLIWNTVGGDGIYDLFVSLNGTAINGPSDAQAAIAQSLVTPGVYNFTIAGQSVGDMASFGLNLYFNNQAAPGISVFAPEATLTNPAPAFTANTSSSTANINGGVVAGAGTLTFVSGGNQVTLSNYRWESATVQNLDNVGPFSRGSNGATDHQGAFTLTVAPVNGAAAPEPSALALAFAGGIPALGVVVRRRKLRRAK